MEEKLHNKQNLFFIAEALHILAYSYETSTSSQKDNFRYSLSNLMETLIDFMDEEKPISLSRLMAKSLSHFADMSEKKILISINLNELSPCAFEVRLDAKSTPTEPISSQLRMEVSADNMYHAMKTYLSSGLSLMDITSLTLK